MLDFDFSVEHVLMFMIVIFLLYHLVNRCGCMKDGFSVGGVLRDITLSKDGTCDYVERVNVNDKYVIVDWSQTYAPACSSNKCNGSDKPLLKFYNYDGSGYVNVNDYNGVWSPTGKTASNYNYDVCTVDNPDITNSGWEELDDCWLGEGERALCGYSIYELPTGGKGGKCDVNSGISGFCKKNEYCVDFIYCCPTNEYSDKCRR